MDVIITSIKYPHIFDKINSHLTFQDIKSCLKVSNAWFETYSRCKNIQRRIPELIKIHLPWPSCQEEEKTWVKIFEDLDDDQSSQLLEVSIEFFEKRKYFSDCTIGFINVSALHVALFSQDTKLFKSILDLSADDNTDDSLLHLAAFYGNIEACKMIIDQLEDKSRIPKNGNGEAPIQIAVRTKNKPLVEFFLSLDWFANPLDRLGNSPLHEAATNDAHDIYQLIMDKVEDKNPKGLNLAITPLHIAAEQGHLSIAELIIDQIVDKNPTCLRGLTPLHCAAEFGHQSVVDLILSNVQDKNPKTNSGTGLTPLHLAVFGGHLSIVKSILKACQNPMDKNPADYMSHQTALHIAVKKGRLDIVKILVDENVANLDSNKVNGWNSLHIAAKKGHVSIYKVLAQRSKDKNPALPNGLTPLHLAALEGHNEMLQHLLIEYGLVQDFLFLKGGLKQRTAYQCAYEIGNMDAIHIFRHTAQKHPRDPLLDRRYLTLQFSIQ